MSLVTGLVIGFIVCAVAIGAVAIVMEVRKRPSKDKAKTQSKIAGVITRGNEQPFELKEAYMGTTIAICAGGNPFVFNESYGQGGMTGLDADMSDTCWIDVTWKDLLPYMKDADIETFRKKGYIPGKRVLVEPT